jgi:hypothetical protein
VNQLLRIVRSVSKAEEYRADAEARLTAHIARHRMEERGERWIGEGMAYIDRLSKDSS